MCITLLIAGLLTEISAQHGDEVLFSVNGQPVTISEFDYIYSKNNSDDAKYSEQSLRDYLNLYINFKLKVEAARAMGLDTIPKLRAELKGYQKQLADSYLMDKKIKEDILKEAYKRSLKDVNISHILVRLGKNFFNKDTIGPYKRIMTIKKQIDSGQISFEEAVKKYSEDKNSRDRAGNIGYINAVLPKGFYDFETVVYSTPVGQLSDPVRSNLGYHIIQVNDIRPARGKMEAAHILIRRPKNEAEYPAAKTKAFNIYKQLKKGLPWDEAVQKYSEDKATLTTNGSLGVFGIGKLDPKFEDAAFALKKDMDISEPIETRYGWHIIRRIAKKQFPDYKQAKVILDNKLKNDERILRAKQVVINQIKEQTKIIENQDVYRQMLRDMDSSFYTYGWKGMPKLKKQILLSIGDMQLYTTDFISYLKKQRGKRIRTKKYRDDDIALRKLYNNYFEEQLLNFEKNRLAEQHPDFKALLREYDEGILLFEATKRKIWDFASKDSIGLVNFFNSHRNNYRWNERIEYTKYEIDTSNARLVKKIRKYAKKHNAVDVYKKYSLGKELLKYITLVKERSPKMPKALQKAQAGKVTKPQYDKKNNLYTFYKIEKTLKPTLKELDEARGFIIADYQDHLEQQWLTDLKKQYKVTINEDVFRSLIK